MKEKRPFFKWWFGQRPSDKKLDRENQKSAIETTSGENSAQKRQYKIDVES